MPTYDYVCKNCNYRFEEFQQMSAAPLKICPNCKNETVKRLISGGNGFLFKGSGFYITDYRSSNYKKDQKADKENVKSNSTANSKKHTKKESKKISAKAD